MRVTKGAVADPALQWRSSHAHVCAINPFAKSQFNNDGTQAEPDIAVEFACKGCHSEAGRAPVLEDARLVEVATGFHERALAGSENRR